MKAPARGLWRPIRYFLLLATAGVVIAADNTWMTRLRFDFVDATNWLTNFYSTEAPSAEAPALVAQTAPTMADTTLSLNGLLNSYLFSKPAAGWQLDAVKFDRASLLMAQQASGPIVQVNGATLPAATFSSGYIAYSSTEFGPLPPSAPTGTDGTWISNASGNWSSASNWQAGTIADGSGATAHFDTLNLTNDVTVNLDSSRTIGQLLIGDTDGTHHYTISPAGGSSLTFDSGTAFVSAVLQQSSTSAGDTISVPILLNSDLDINNLSTANQLLLSGNIASSGAVNSSQIIWFNNTTGALGNIRVSGNISDGSTGGALNLVVVNGGTVTLTGTNTYTGFTEVDGGTLLINGANSGPGSVYVYDTGTLGGHGTIAGNVYTFGGTITGDTATTVGTLTLQGSVNLATGEGAGGTYLANLSGSLSDLLAITGSLTLGSGTTLNIVGGADGITTYILATFGSLNSTFDTVMGLPGGYALVYNQTDIELVPIPEPATWIGAALALGAIALTRTRKKAEKLKS